jgi:hypothetical protein
LDYNIPTEMPLDLKYSKLGGDRSQAARRLAT